MGALVFYNPEHRILISGDALWESGYGLVMPVEVDPRALPAARATWKCSRISTCASSFQATAIRSQTSSAALERAFSRTAAFEADSVRVARHALKALFMFALLDKQRMRIDDLPAYFARVGIYREFNTRYFRLSPSALAELLVGELERSRAAHRNDGWLRPGPE